jgi:hypothetical protein
MKEEKWFAHIEPKYQVYRYNLPYLLSVFASININTGRLATDLLPEYTTRWKVLLWPEVFNSLSILLIRLSNPIGVSAFSFNIPD